MTRALRQPIESYGVRGFHHGLRPATSMVSAGCSRNNFVPHCLVANGPNGITSFCQVPSQRSISPEFDRSRMGRLPCLVPAILFAWTPSLSTGTVTLSMSILLTSRPATFPHHRGCRGLRGLSPSGVENVAGLDVGRMLKDNVTLLKESEVVRAKRIAGTRHGSRPTREPSISGDLLR